MKGLFSLLLTITGCLAAPMADDLGLEVIGLGEDKTDHRAIVDLTKFVRDHLALDVEENRRFAERIGNQTEVVANAILKHVNDLNRDSTTKFEVTLTKLQETIDENLGAIVNQTKENHEALEVQSREIDKPISEETARNFNSLLSGLKGRLSQHERMLNTHVAHIAPRGAKKEEAFCGVISKSERPSGALFTNSGPHIFNYKHKIEGLSPLGTSFH